MSLGGPPDLAEHAATCTKSQGKKFCAEASSFLRNRARWSRRFLVHAEHPELGTWLGPCWRDGALALFCCLCSAFFKETTYVSGRPSSHHAGNLRRHERSERHLQAKCGLMGVEHPVDKALAKSPAESTFRDILKHRRALAPNRKGVCSNGVMLGRKKVTMMSYALAEGKRVLERSFMRGAS